MGRHGNKKSSQSDGRSGTDLINFHFATAPPPLPQQQQQQQRTDRRGGGGGGRGRSNNHNNSNTNYRKKNKQQEFRRTKEDRASARRKASSAMFNLHSSPDHAFVLSRRPPSHHQPGATSADAQQQNHHHHYSPSSQPNHYAFQGSDAPVSWASVRIVKYFAAAADEENCPICLDSMKCCPRTTKCGHNFCLTCLLRHVHVYAATHPYCQVGAKCPCCAIPLRDLDDVRPVEIVVTAHPRPPAVHTMMRFTKLHRVKGCAAPHLPRRDCPRRASPHAAPRQTDVDAMYCRFNYVDPEAYTALLHANLQQLQRSVAADDTETLCRHLAVEIVQKQIAAATRQAAEERQLLQRFQSASAGFYQSQPRHLLASSYSYDCCNGTEDETNHVKLSSGGADMSTPTTPLGAWSDTEEDVNPSKMQKEHPVEQRVPMNDDTLQPLPAGRFRGESIGSEVSYESSVVSEGRSLGRSRAGSTTSHDEEQAAAHSSSPSQRDTRRKPVAAGGSMYLEADESVFYQAEDGTLCFLNGFNMNCLRTEFSAQVPDAANWTRPHITPAQRRHLEPLPDTIEGKIMQVEHVHLTPDVRQRLRFLSHLPLYMDIVFVELNLGNYLSPSTKKAFAKDFNRRKQARVSKVQAEKREDAKARKLEEARIQDLKGRMQRIDPNDDFFQPVVGRIESPVVLTGEEFGPAMTSASWEAAHSHPAMSPREPELSFSAITRSGGAFPNLMSSSESAFPALGSSPPIVNKTTPSWGGRVYSSVLQQAPTPTFPGASNKKKKGKKVLLFSTGAHRGSAF